MKLDITQFRYITKDEFRVLTAVEMGMRNHELVPVPLIDSISKVNRGLSYKLLNSLLRNKLVAHENKTYDGYRMTYKGYDFLALRALAARGTIVSVGRRLGVGKESDVHYCQGPNGEAYALKLHRLGRISFRAIKSKRDYLQHRTHGSWMYMARLAALKEFAYMKALHDEGFPVPTPVDQNRHCVIMSLVEGVPMYTIRDMTKPHVVLERLMRLLIRLARAGIVHSDFNEFNLLIGEDAKVTLIDFPQIIHLHHPNAREHFDRDVRSICEWFRKKCDLVVEERPSFDEVLKEVEADNGAVLSSLNVQGLGRDADAMLVAAHGAGADRALGDEDEEDDEDDEEEEEEEAVDTQADDGLAGLLPEGGCGELADPGEEIDGQEQEPVAAAEATEAAADEKEPGAAASDAESSGDEGSGDEEQGPGQVTVPSTRKTRKKQSAKEARSNLMKQQKTKPAKPNNQKVREMRNAKHQVKEYFC